MKVSEVVSEIVTQGLQQAAREARILERQARRAYPNQSGPMYAPTQYLADAHARAAEVYEQALKAWPPRACTTCGGCLTCADSADQARTDCPGFCSCPPATPEVP